MLYKKSHNLNRNHHSVCANPYIFTVSSNCHVPEHFDCFFFSLHVVVNRTSDCLKHDVSLYKGVFEIHSLCRFDDPKDTQLDAFVDGFVLSLHAFHVNGTRIG